MRRIWRGLGLSGSSEDCGRLLMAISARKSIVEFKYKQINNKESEVACACDVLCAY